MMEGKSLVPCIVEGRYFEIDGDDGVRFVENIGYVHETGNPHTVLGDPIDPDDVRTPQQVDARQGDPG